MDRLNITPAVARFDYWSCILSVVVIANPTIKSLFVSFEYIDWKLASISNMSKRTSLKFLRYKNLSPSVDSDDLLELRVAWNSVSPSWFSLKGGNFSTIFLGFRHQSWSWKFFFLFSIVAGTSLFRFLPGLMQFQSTQGNQSAIPISIVLKTMSWVLRLLKSTL